MTFHLPEGLYCQKGSDIQKGKSMIRIGLFSAITRVPAKTLRYYDEIGLLKPEGLDKNNAYRLYAVSQIREVYRIQAFKRMGFKLEKIRELLQEDFPSPDVQVLLASRRSEILGEIFNLQSQLESLENFRKVFSDEVGTTYLADFKPLAGVEVLVFSANLEKYEDLTEHWLEFLRLSGRFSSNFNGPQFCRYIDGEYRSRDIQVELCVPLNKKLEAGAPLVYKELKPVKLAACLLHEGSYQNLGLSYSKLFEEMQKNHLAICGFPREVYLQAAGLFPENEYLTEIQIPVREINKNEKEN